MGYVVWVAVTVFLLLVQSQAAPLRGFGEISLLELGTSTSWAGWAPKMKSSFDIETHAWKPPWFQDGVKGVYVEPFPSNIWLSNGLAVPLMDADKYFFKKESTEDGPDPPSKEDQELAAKAAKAEEDGEEVDGPVPRVGGVPVPVALQQYKQMKENKISPDTYVPGSIVGQQIFNDWWRELHEREPGPSQMREALEELREWFIPHVKKHAKDIKHNWLEYFKHSLGLFADEGEDPLEKKKKEQEKAGIAADPDKVQEYGPIQNTQEAEAARKNFWFKPFPSGECVNIGSGVYCTPMIRPKPLPKPLEIPSLIDAGRIHKNLVKAEAEAHLGTLTMPEELNDERKRKEQGREIYNQSASLRGSNV